MTENEESSVKHLLASYAYSSPERCCTSTHGREQKRQRTQSAETGIPRSVSSKYFNGGDTTSTACKSKSPKSNEDLSNPEVYRNLLTPLERSVVRWKQSYPGVALFIQIGHRFRLFGPEAVILAHLRGYKHFKLNNFRLCSFPVAFADRAMAAAVNAGFRVGLISQKESAPLKYAEKDSRNARSLNVEGETFGELQLFDRGIDHIFTYATYSAYKGNVHDDIITLSLFEKHVEPGIGHQLNQMLYPQTVSFGAIILNCKTGSIRYRQWQEHGNSREDLYLFLENLNPSELLIPDCYFGERQYCVSAPTLVSLKRFAKRRSVALKMPPNLACYGLYDANSDEHQFKSAVKGSLEQILEAPTVPQSSKNDCDPVTHGTVERVSDLSYFGLWPSIEMNGKYPSPAPVYSGDEIISDDALNIPEGPNFRIEWLPENYFTDERTNAMVTRRIQSLPVNLEGKYEIERALVSLVTYFLRCKCDTEFLSDKMSPWESVGGHMRLSERTAMDLELFGTSVSRTGKGSLLDLMSHRICTRDGCRRLREWIEWPLTDEDSINERLEVVESFQGFSSWEGFVNSLRQLPNYYDFQRNFQLLRIGQLSPAKCCLFFHTLSTLTEAALSSAGSSGLNLLLRMTERISTQVSTNSVRALEDLEIYEAFKRSSDPEGNITQLVGFLKRRDSGKRRYETAPSTSYSGLPSSESPINAFKEDVEHKKYPQLSELKEKLDDIEKQLHDELDTLRVSMNRPDLQYREPLYLANGTTEEYLIELDRRDPLVCSEGCSATDRHEGDDSCSMLPYDWIPVSETSKVVRFRPPRVEKLANRERGDLALTRAHLEISYCTAWRQWQQSVAASINQSVDALFTLVEVIDITQSLGSLAAAYDYTRPTILPRHAECGLWALQARHPLMEAVGPSYRDNRLDQLKNSWTISGSTTDDTGYVPNDISIGKVEDPAKLRHFIPQWLLERSCNTLILSGPNMGGKSTYCRMCCLIVIMAQLGSFVPAENCAIRCFDNVLTSIGLYDDACFSASSYMTEMRQLSSILSSATSRTFVAIDELGRRTSAREGSAVGEAILEYLHHTLGCRTICTSHLTKIIHWAGRHKSGINSATMSVLPKEDTFPVFLFRLEYGTSTRSYGLEVAMGAGVPYSVVERANKYLTYFNPGYSSA